MRGTITASNSSDVYSHRANSSNSCQVTVILVGTWGGGSIALHGDLLGDGVFVALPGMSWSSDSMDVITITGNIGLKLVANSVTDIDFMLES